VMAPAYDYAIGGIQDHWGDLLATAYKYRTESKGNAMTSYDDLERSLTAFRRAEAAW